MTTLFEVSWEVCNKVGGIYTVIRSKVPFIQSHYDPYILIGPYTASQEFELAEAPASLNPVLEAMQSRGIVCHYGHWVVPGRPAVILLDFRQLVSSRNELKYRLWEHFKIDSLNAAWEFDEPMCFATAAGMLIEEYANHFTKETVIAQCHEWIAGFALLHLKSVNSRVGTVFTTHATMLGRTMAGNGYALYEMLSAIDPNEWAHRLNVQDKHTTEVACAKAADVFTTVSDITGVEAEHLLGRKPDVLLYNGFHIDRFPTFEETSLRHYHARELLHEFIAYSFFPYYAFDLRKTLLFFTSGRYEFQNKGMDVIIESLGKLNKTLIEQKSATTVVMLFWVIMGKGNLRQDVLENKNLYHEVKAAVEWQSKPLMHNIILDFLSGHTPGSDDRFTSGFIRSIQEDMRRISREGSPPLATHAIPDSDAILSACKAHGLTNSEQDRVKIILYPGYVDGGDGLLNLPYYDAIVGTHLGIFPSAYEPWGYTPLESAVLGVPAVTTDVAGFGRFVELSQQSKGVFVLNRSKSRDFAVAQLTTFLESYVALPHAERVSNGFAAKSIASLCDWNNFIDRYLQAHRLAGERHG